MNKKFKRFLASMLAALMVISAMPFSALAVEQSYLDSLKNYIGYEDLDKYKDDMFNPDTEEGIYYAGVGITLNPESADEENEIYLMDCLKDNYKPKFHVIVSDYSNRTNVVYGSVESTFDTVEAAGLIKDPTDLHAGDKITVSVEVSGLDSLYAAQFNANFNPDYLKAAYYKKSGAKYTWSAATAATNNVINSGADTGSCGDGVYSNGGSQASLTANRVFGTIASLKNPYAVYVTKNLAEQMGTGTFGCIIATFSFEVLQDCSLADSNIWTWDTRWGYTYAQAYSDDDYEFVDQLNPGHEGHFADRFQLPEFVYEGAATTGCNHAITEEVGDVKKPATCIATGIKEVTVICTECGDVVTPLHEETIPVDSTNHAGTKTNSDVVTKTPATCINTGVGEYTVTCDDCGVVIDTKTVELVLDSSNHTNITSEVTPAKCTEDGYTTFTCNDCKESWTGEPTTATDHAYGDWAHVTGTENADAQHSRVCANDANHVETEACDFETVETIPATVTSEGSTTYKCKDCGYSYTEVIPVQDCDHANTRDVETSRKAATCVDPGEIYYDVVCNDCGKTARTKTEPLAIDPTNHADAATDTRDVNVVAATCGTDGSKDVETYCTACGVTRSTEPGVTIPATNDHKATSDVETSRKAATCVAEGEVNYNVVCDECGAVVDTKTDPLDIDPTNHADAATATRDANVVEATCGAAGSKDVETYCTACGVTLSTKSEVILPTGNHTAGEPVTTVTKPATVDEAGVMTTTVNCTVCGELINSYPEEIPVIASYTVTVEPATLGTVTINGVDATNGAEVKVAKDPVSQVTLVATPNENATFIGWMANGKTLVSTDETRVATVLANITYTPVFALSDTEFTVTFVDAYGNVIDTQKVADAAAIVTPDAPARPGYTFTGWSMTADEIAAIDGATTIQAVYEKNAEDLFKVIANGCTITVNGADVADYAEDVAYDTRVTVTAEGATAWKIGDVIVAYGDSYTFYVGSDVEVTPVTDTTVTAEPTVANVSKTPVVEANGLKRCTFLATRSMEGFKCVNYGFVYANTKNLEITLDDVDGTNVKAFYCQTGVDQFSLTYGLKSQKGTVSVRAFVAYIDAQGKTQVKYADADTFSYDKAE